MRLARQLAFSQIALLFMTNRIFDGRRQDRDGEALGWLAESPSWPAA